jgi:hypothetical protein
MQVFGLPGQIIRNGKKTRRGGVLASGQGAWANGRASRQSHRRGASDPRSLGAAYRTA